MRSDSDRPLAIAGSRLFFPGADEETGLEPWAIVLGHTTSCPADCDRDGITTPADLRQAVGIALRYDAFSSCVAADSDGDGRVTVEEIVDAVRRRMEGECAG